jgi:membrane-bound metal-dependent hydrolase YbcI (DUF457 family)
MPSPVGHGLGGLAAGWLIMRRPPGAQSLPVTTAAAFAALGAAADLDLLFGVHRGPAHSIGAALMAGLAAWAITARKRPDLRLAVAVAVAYGSHVLLDWLGSDPTPPSGVWALWPLSHEYYLAPWQVFLGTSRRFHDHRFWMTNVRALVRELAILLPVLLVVAYTRLIAGRRAGRSFTRGKEGREKSFLF